MNIVVVVASLSVQIQFVSVVVVGLRRSRRIRRVGIWVGSAFGSALGWISANTVPVRLNFAIRVTAIIIESVSVIAQFGRSLDSISASWFASDAARIFALIGAGEADRLGGSAFVTIV